MSERVRVRVEITRETDVGKPINTWQVERWYAVLSLKQLLLHPAEIVMADLNPDMRTMLDKVLA